MGKSRRRPPNGDTPQVQASKPPTSAEMALRLPPPGFVADNFGWLRQIFVFAGLEEHLEAAALWADQTGCIQKDLCNQECMQELIDHLTLKKFPAIRLQNALDACATSGCEEDACSVNTAASTTEPNILMAAEAACDDLSEPSVAEADVEAEGFQTGQTVLVEFDGLPYYAKVQHQNPDGTFRVIYDVDGTYEDVKGERVTEEVVAEAETEFAASEGQTKVSKTAKKRARKQIRDAAYAALESGKAHVPQQSLQPPRPASAPKKNVVSEPLMALAQSTWSVSKQGCKAHAELTIPSKCVGWIIGTNGSTIKSIEQKYLVTVQLVSQTVSVYGKQERVKQAVSHIDQILWQGFSGY